MNLIGQHLSDSSRDLATLSFDLEGHGACRWCGSSCSVCVPSLKFGWKIWRTSSLSISRPGDLDLWPRIWGALLLVGWTTFLPILVFLGRFVLNLSVNTCQTHHVTLRPWPWRSRRLSLMRVFVLHLCTKFEVRRPSRLEDIGHLVRDHYSAWWPWPFDLKIGSLVTRVMGFHSAKFGLPRPFCSPVMSRHATDRQPDRQTTEGNL